MSIQVKSDRLLSTIRNNSKESNYISPCYITLAEKYGFHNGGVWIKETNKRIFLETLSDPKSFDEIQLKLKRFGKIRFDLDGLKSVNDIGSHQLGDILLELVAEALLNNKVTRFCHSFSLRIEVDRAGGDEFDFFVERLTGELDDNVDYELLPGKTIRRPVISLLRDIVALEVSRSPFVEMDFHDSEIQKNLGEYGCFLLDKAESHFGRKFYFTPSVSSGECIFWTAFTDVIESNPKENISMGKLGEILMGKVEDISGNLVTVRKHLLKERLWTSPNSEKNMQALLITRSQSDKEKAVCPHKVSQIKILGEKRISLFNALDGLQEIRVRCYKENNPKEITFLKEVEEIIPHIKSQLTVLEKEQSTIIQTIHKK